ncbi:type III secretion system cytoplasmic ring protein SctQ [Luteimonas sp. A611]
MADPTATRRKAAGPKRRQPATPAGEAPRPLRPLRGLLPTLSTAQAAALRSFFATPQTWSLSNHGLLQFIPGRPAPAAQTFELDAEGTRLGLALQGPTHGDGAHWSDYQGRSRVLAWSLANEAQLMRLSEAFGVVLTPLVDAGDAAQDEASLLWLDFIVDEDAPEGSTSRMPALQGALRVPASWLERLLERADPPSGEAAPLDGWRELGVPIQLQWRIAPLPWADWNALQPGDVLVAGRRSQPPQAEACARAIAWPIAPAADGWRISGPPRHLQTHVQEISPMNDTPQASEDGDADALARRLPVDLAFELGRTELRVGDLSALQPGYVFPLAGALEGANVTIRANGQAVGQGEVVAVGDTLGVRLLGWS